MSGRSESPLRVAVAGATGFIGQALCRDLAERHQVFGLSRSAEETAPTTSEPGLFWRQCDLFSMIDVEQALEGVDVAYYLVHSMLPSARLTQATFRDMDLILADNFARAAERCGVKQIIYLSGLIPPGHQLSHHLASRLEVEEVFQAGSVPVTVLRAGLIIGANGSSFSILVRLVERLPVMITPGWTLTPTQPIALRDVVTILGYCLNNSETFGETHDIGGPEITSYRKLIEVTADVMGVRRRLVSVPFFSPNLSRLWVSLVTETPRELVAPLVQSLKYRLTTRSRTLQERMGLPGTPIRDAIEDALRGMPVSRGEWWDYARFLLAKRQRKIRKSRAVRSVQRLPLPQGKDATWVAVEYARWLPQFLRPFIRVDVDGDHSMRFGLSFPRLTLLELTFAPNRSTPDRQLYYITGGMLLRKSDLRGRLEFREVLDRSWVIAAIHDFTPLLPWWIYNLSQALVHLWVMRAFGRHLDRVIVETPAIAPASAKERSR